MCETNHTKSAIKVAEVITRDNYDSPNEKYETEYGKKTIVGIADMIDNETGLADLLKVCKAALPWIESQIELTNDPCRVIANKMKEAIKKAES